MTSSPPRFLTRLNKAWHDRAVVLKAISFGIVGTINFAIDLAVFSFSYYYLDLSIIVANCISWSVAVTCSYVLNTMITFGPESGRKLEARKYAGFALMQSLGFFANTATVLAAGFFMPVWAGKFLAAGASFVVNFSLSHFVVFRSRDPGKPS